MNPSELKGKMSEGGTKKHAQSIKALRRMADSELMKAKIYRVSGDRILELWTASMREQAKAYNLMADALEMQGDEKDESSESLAKSQKIANVAQFVAREEKTPSDGRAKSA